MRASGFPEFTKKMFNQDQLARNYGYMYRVVSQRVKAQQQRQAGAQKVRKTVDDIAQLRHCLTRKEKTLSSRADLLAQLQLRIQKTTQACHRFSSAPNTDALFAGEVSRLEHENEIERELLRMEMGGQAAASASARPEGALASWPPPEETKEPPLRYYDEDEEEEEEEEEEEAHLQEPVQEEEEAVDEQ